MTPPGRLRKKGFRGDAAEALLRAALPQSEGMGFELRPIRSEDVPLWKPMMGSCSLETRSRRFGHVMTAATDEAAACYCLIDYERERAIVAAIDEQPKCMIGVVRMAANSDHGRVFAFLQNG